jgi:hypothetical protein
MLRSSATSAARFLHNATAHDAERIASTGSNDVTSETMGLGATIKITGQDLTTGITGLGRTPRPYDYDDE